MLIVCPSCTTTYDLSADALGPEGRSVRCVKCQIVWHADPHEEPAFAEAEMQADWGSADNPEGWGDVDAAADPPGEDVALTDPGARALAMDRDDGLDHRDVLADHESPPIAPDDGLAPPIEDIETIAARRALRESQSRKRRIKPWLTLSILFLTGVLGGILGLRAEIVRALPQTASLFRMIGLPVNLRGLEFSDVFSLREVVDGVTVLVIEGKITNVTRISHEVPRIRLALLNAAGGEVYAWTTVPTQAVVAPGAVETFRTRLASPPAEGRGIAVRFLNRRDAIGGLK